MRKWLFRWDKGYEACRLAEVPHVRLTAPLKVFRFEWDGAGNRRGRENLLQLPITASGTLNAIVFWFDLQLDAESIVTSGARHADVPSSWAALSIYTC